MTADLQAGSDPTAGSASVSRPSAPVGPLPAGPQFYLTPPRRLSAGAILLALVLALAVLLAVAHALNRSHLSGASSADDDDDDPSRVDTIYLGGPGEAPTAARPASKPSSVHPFVVVHLPRSGDQFGQIPDTPAGRLLYAWLAAFNGPDPSALVRALPTPDAELAEAAEVELRRQTGGFTLMSAREVQPGVLVFRLHDQTTSANEVLGTLQVNPGSAPASIASFSLQEVAVPQTKLP